MSLWIAPLKHTPLHRANVATQKQTRLNNTLSQTLQNRKRLHRSEPARRDAIHETRD